MILVNIIYNNTHNYKLVFLMEILTLFNCKFFVNAMYNVLYKF